MKVLSLFDGMSCGQIALHELGIKVTAYYASEINKPAIKVAKANFPKMQHIGDVRDIKATDFNGIDLLIGGSPCQCFSFAGKRQGMVTIDNIEILSLDHYLQLKNAGFEFEGESYLFWEYVRVLREVKPRYFFLENVMMAKKWKRIISKELGVNPIKINSALLSAQNRNRYYWTNIGMQPAGLFGDAQSIIKPPTDKNIFLKHILQNDVDPKYFLSEKMMQSLLDWEKRNKDAGSGYKCEFRTGDEKSSIVSTGSMKSNSTFIKMDTKGNVKSNQNKASCFTAGGNSGGLHSDMDIIVHNTMPRSSKTGKGGTGPLSRQDGKTYCLDTGKTNAIEIVSGTLRTHNDGKGFRVIASGKGAAIPARAREDGSGQNVVSINNIARRLTPIECERLQTVPDNYTNHVSDTQRYKMLGNGWTVAVIKHIFSYLK